MEQKAGQQITEQGWEAHQFDDQATEKGEADQQEIHSVDCQKIICEEFITESWRALTATSEIKKGRERGP
ncbi:hypothetical protein GCM10007392_04140 [Saccharospirillum salsuginis]|uniref:Uncharacterized protein n=1 Tax=Saccharospirillum salsuginis TaxID=418750 RepID=A0A918K196_9GAMM|nr:hypothetical protein GCM10007392_04140 [Saccharospirillum salsuginis]